MIEGYLYEADDDDKVIGKNDKGDPVTVRQALDSSSDDPTMVKLKKKAQDLKAKDNGDEEKPDTKKGMDISKTGGVGGDEPEKITKGPGGYGDRGNVRGGDQRNFGEPDDEEYFKSMMGGGEPEDKPHGGDTGKDADFEEPSGEPEGGDDVDKLIKQVKKGGIPGDEWNKVPPKVKKEFRSKVTKIYSTMKKLSDNDEYDKLDKMEEKFGLQLWQAKGLYDDFVEGDAGTEFDEPEGGEKEPPGKSSGIDDDPFDNLDNMFGGDDEKERPLGGKEAEAAYHKADMMMKKYAGVDIKRAEYWAKKKKEAADAMLPEHAFAEMFKRIGGR